MKGKKAGLGNAEGKKLLIYIEQSGGKYFLVG